MTRGKFVQKTGKATATLLVLAGSMQAAVLAQEYSADDLMALDKDALRGEIDQRFEAALAASNDPAIINANDTRHVWASEAKAQCGIAKGYLRSGTKDPVSIGKCDDAYRRMSVQPVASAPPPPPVAQPDTSQCDTKIAGIVFFEFDSAVPPPDTEQTIEFVQQNYGLCQWSGFDVVGHTDRAGSDAYNQGLSEARAQAVTSRMISRGIPASMITTDARGESEPRVPTIDGERNPQNRRVEITIR